MSQSCRDAICLCYDRNGKDYSLYGTNAGLIKDRYLRLSADDVDRKNARSELLEAMCWAITQLDRVYEEAFRRNKNSFLEPLVEDGFRIIGRMVIGIGGENVLETGLTLHHIYGTPIIPGTALKGLVSHYCNQAWGIVDDRFKVGGTYHQTIFGTTEDSGHIIFHDAWITPDTLKESLQPDVMTPHHSEYYSGKAAPTDFDDPNPVTFLSVVGTFHVAVSCDVPGDEGEKWVELAFGMLSDALRERGIGGKTNAGYGRLVRFMEGSKAKTDFKTTPSEQVSVKVAEPQVHRPRYKKGETIEVTREEDPNIKRGKTYFRADDGFGGFVTRGVPPSIEIGKKTRLEVAGVMAEGYSFAAIGSRDEDRHLKKNRRERR